MGKKMTATKRDQSKKSPNGWLTWEMYFASPQELFKTGGCSIRFGYEKGLGYIKRPYTGCCRNKRKCCSRN